MRIDVILSTYISSVPLRTMKLVFKCIKCKEILTAVIKVLENTTDFLNLLLEHSLVLGKFFNK